MRAAIYSRKSKFTGKGESVENQVHLCKEHGKKYLEINNEEDFIIYEDEGFSGGDTNRPQFKKMLRDAKAKKFNVLICYRLDRISRNVSDFSQLINELNKYNVGFVSIKEQFDTSTPMGRAMMYIASVFSQLERETIAERIRDNMLELAKTGRWLGGVPPTGFVSEPVITKDLSGKERKMFKLVPVPEEINLVKMIFDKYLKFKSITQVEKYLTMNNICTKNGLDFRRFSIRSILANPVYAIADRVLYDHLISNEYEVFSSVEDFNGISGLTAYNKTNQEKNSSERFRDSSEWIIAVGMHPGVVSSSAWIETQELLERNKSKAYRKVKSTQSLLSGVLRCGKCGGFMRPKATTRKTADGEKVFYYMCEMKEKSRKTRCDMNNINGNNLDSSVLNELKKLASKNSPIFEKIFSRKSLIESAQDVAQSEIDVLKNKLTETELGINNLINAITKGQSEVVINTMVKRLEEMTKEKETISIRLEELQDVEKVAGFNNLNLDLIRESLGTINDKSWRLMGVEDKRNIIKSITEKIIWDGEKVDLMLFGSMKLPEEVRDNLPDNEKVFPQCKDSKRDFNDI